MLQNTVRTLMDNQSSFNMARLRRSLLRSDQRNKWPD